MAVPSGQKWPVASNPRASAGTRLNPALVEGVARGAGWNPMYAPAGHGPAQVPSRWKCELPKKPARHRFKHSREVFRFLEITPEVVIHSPKGCPRAES